MNCRDLREQFSAYLDGELPVDEAQALGRHVEGCAECARELDDLRRTIEALADLPVIKAPEDLKAKILAEIEIESVDERRRPVSHMRSLWPAAAAIIVAVVLAWQGGMFESRKQAIRPVVASARRGLAHDEEMREARPEGHEALRAMPTMSAAPEEESGVRKKMAYDGGLKDEAVTGKGGYAFKEKGDQSVLSPEVTRQAELNVGPKKAGEEDARIAGTWSVPSGNPVTARALVVKLLDKRIVAQPRAEKESQEKALAFGTSQAEGATTPVELEVTRAEWGRLVSALKENGMTPKRQVVEPKALAAREVTQKRENGDALAKQGDADNNEVAGKDAETALADKTQAQAKPEADDAKSAVAEETEMQQSVTESLVRGESPQRFRVRLLFPRVSSEE